MKDAIEADAQRTLRETLGKYGPFLDERSGIFASLREYALPWESPIHLCTGELKPEFCFSTLSARPAISLTVCGAGTSALQARLTCLGEALERHSGVFRGNEPRRVARYSEIAAEAILPDALTLFSEEQYNNREEWNRREGRHNWVPERFDAERSIDWSPAWSLTQQRTKYLPTAYCYFGYPFDPNHDFCRPDSNGNAAGNSPDEAIVHGFLELVERECASIWWYNRVRRPRVDLDSFGSPDILAVRNLHRMIGRSVEVMDIGASPHIPVFVAVSRSEDPPGEDYVLGFGAHFDALIALRRALTEMSQFLPVVLSGHDPHCFLRAEDGQTDMSFLVLNEELEAITCSDFPAPTVRDVKHDVLFGAELTQAWGLEMLVLEQTRQDMGIPVVKVVVPGMRNWWARFAPGRLYTLPVQPGWLAAQKSEPELNPNHLIL
jgi:ribosomal protein S12 methylthiotransferase accessory factor